MWPGTAPVSYTHLDVYKRQDVIHCNDWQTALVPIYRQDLAGRWDALRSIRTVFTIHNVEYLSLIHI